MTADTQASLDVHPDRLLPSQPEVRDVARRLYATIKDLPIISPHAHVPPQWLVENKPFADPVSLLLSPDHYVLRMLHANGAELSDLGRGPDGPVQLDEAGARKAWRILCENYYLFRGTPVKYWFDTTFAEVFGITQVPSAETADAIYDQIAALGLPQMLFDHFPGRLEYHEPWHTGRELSHLFRGDIDVDEGNRLLREAGHDDLRLLDNGSIRRQMPGIEQTKAYHLVPLGVSKAAAVAAHMQARGYTPDECIAAGDSVEDLGMASAVGHFYVVANGPAKDPHLRTVLSAYTNASVTEASNGAGVYEAVVGHLMRNGPPAG